ncbi:glycosyl transferase [Burkholderia ubonensis]|uniref:Glycosyl transferase n=1 Tax=Burkholderia ubonensis TaxID=101571 RepID=A0AB73FV78_9BURK|nr:glycosyltransferase family A protein [Burkholderia ubonensis]KVK83877.1 glycosyl transferase [Burkholderia ubonensis]KVL82917.1 glycosyl transferase [Burkholderia ubonensis]KVM23914.1 glycosyl transferase [Burkholderia ubonensis]KVM35417.1 glycosyl transferase [Burkholderia ubonensis]
MTDLTIAICNYNHAAYLRDAIDSALAQTASGVRTLVVDDGSTDASRDIIASYGERITAVFQTNGGQVSAYNRALEHVASRYVIFLDADDVLYPDAVRHVLDAFAAGGHVKVHYRLDVLTHDGATTGVTVPQSVVDADCGRLLRAGWLYPSPPGSGNAYAVAALRRLFPVPVNADNRHGADFYAIYGSALLGSVYMIDRPLGGYRAHQSTARAADSASNCTADLAFANAEDAATGAAKTGRRWSTLRTLAATQLYETLPTSPYDFSIEKALFASALYRAPLGRRWRWFLHESGRYWHTVLHNPFWPPFKKLAVCVITLACLLPLASISDRAIRYLVNPMARARSRGRAQPAPGRNSGAAE